jgi:hypothetical protein
MDSGHPQFRTQVISALGQIIVANDGKLKRISHPNVLAVIHVTFC